MYKNPKNVKYQVKLVCFYLIDIFVVMGFIFFAYQLATILALSLGMKIFLFIVSVLFGGFLCLKTPTYPTDRTVKVLMQLMQRDQNRYYPIECDDINNVNS